MLTKPKSVILSVNLESTMQLVDYRKQLIKKNQLAKLEYVPLILEMAMRRNNRVMKMMHTRYQITNE